MSRKLLAALAITMALAEPVAAELRGTPDGPPTFTAPEIMIITRNAALSTLIQENPWLVRQLLNALATVEPAAPTDRPAQRTDDQGVGGAARDVLDPRANPDLDRLQRASPEAALDLFQLLKQAATRKTQTPAK